MTFSTDEGVALRLDREDRLAPFRERFYRLPGTIYMDGNSLGLLSRDAEESVVAAVEQWRRLGVGGWIDADPAWFTLGETLGAQTAGLVGAALDEVVVTGTTTVNLHALLASFYRPDGRRRRIIADELNFPSDIYAIQSHLRTRGLDPAETLTLVRSRDGRTICEDDVAAALDETAALVLLPSVLYRSGQLLDLARVTRDAHAAGALAGFDLSHSAGLIPHQLSAEDVDFAFWCTYKYLNSGPGGTGALYVNQRHHGADVGLAGWWGYRKERQFDMALDWEAAGGAGAWQVSTIPVLSAAALAGSLRVTIEAGIEAIRAKSLLLTDYLIYLAEALLAGEPYGFAVGTPREHARRGGHVALEHPREAVRIVKALRARGVVPDFRPPNVVRLAPIALYSSFTDVWHVVMHLREIMERREYETFAAGRDVVA